MNKEKFNHLLSHVALQQAMPSRINFKLADSFDPRVPLQAYSRVNWRTGDIAITELEFETPEGSQKQSFMRCSIVTRTRLVKIGEAGVPPDSQEPEESDVLMDAEIDFMLEYAIVDCRPEEFDQETINEFLSKNVPFQMWPYYRELVQSLAVRARLPAPAIPPFRLPSSHVPSSQQATKK